MTEFIYRVLSFQAVLGRSKRKNYQKTGGIVQIRRSLGLSRGKTLRVRAIGNLLIIHYNFQAGSTSLAEWEGKMAADFAAELKKNREEKLNASKKKEKKEKKKGEI